ncbi:MAG: site-specific integrase [Lacipirellulaceae bacterium]
MSNASFLRPPKYRRHKAKGLAVVTLNGRDIYLGKYNSAASKQEYQRLVGEWLQGGGQLRDDRQTEITVSEVMAAYVRFARGYYRKNGKPTREYEMIVESCKLIKPLYGRCRAVDFGPLSLKAVRQVMIGLDHSRRYINKNVDRVKRMFKWAAAEEMIPASIPQALSMVTGLRKGRTEARENPPVLPVDDSVVDATLAHLPEVVADMVRFQRATGCRPNEVCQLRPCDVDRGGDVWTYRPESHKTEHHGKTRVILCGPKAQAILLKYLARDAQAYCFRPCDSEAKRRASKHATRITPQATGNRPGTNRKRKAKCKAGEMYSTDSYRRAIHRACDKHDIEKWAPNRLRHTAATEIRREFGLEAAQVILGHSSADVTQVYAERDLAKGIEVVRKIG